MKKKHSSHLVHPIHYIFLLIIIVSASISIIFLNYQRMFQLIAVGFLSLGYLLWGILHHLKENELNIEIFLEYFLISLFGATMLIAIILQA